jgi:thioredoxin reductase (NADPH)
MCASSYKCDVASGNCYHTVIVGGGPAAVAAAIYLHRFDFKVIMIAPEYGGAISRTYLIENYPGFSNISGMELMEAFQKHYEYFKIPFVYETVVSVDKHPEMGYITKTSDGTEYKSCTVIIASGTKYRKLNIAGEEALHGRGVSYCATCDGPFFRDKDVAVIGGSDSAAVEALFLSKFAKSVSIIYRKEKIRAEPINAHRCAQDLKIKIINNTIISEILGKDKVTGIKINNGTVLPMDGVFIEIGSDPNVDMIKKLGVKLNEKNEIIVNQFAQTNVQGIFAAGDVTNIREKQVITACGQAVTAAYSVRDFMDNNFCV